MNASTLARIDALWTAGNNAGHGFAAPGETVEDAVAAYEADGGIVLHRAQNTSEVSVVRKGQFLYVVGDSAGGWCVRLPATALDA